MKHTLRRLSLVAAAVFALATLVQALDLARIPAVPALALAGGCLAACVLALVLGDYQRKPAFRVRRNDVDGTDAGPTVNRPAGQEPDWTYTTRVK
jgi:hypothetical protein